MHSTTGFLGSVVVVLGGPLFFAGMISGVAFSNNIVISYVRRAASKSWAIKALTAVSIPILSALLLVGVSKFCRMGQYGFVVGDIWIFIVPFLFAGLQCDADPRWREFSDAFYRIVRTRKLVRSQSHPEDELRRSNYVQQFIRTWRVLLCFAVAEICGGAIAYSARFDVSLYTGIMSCASLLLPVHRWISFSTQAETTIWCGAAFASPLGVIAGIIWQRAAPSRRAQNDRKVMLLYCGASLAMFAFAVYLTLSNQQIGGKPT